MSLTVRGALLWSFAERYTSLIVTIISTMLLARLLTPAQVGIFSLCAAATAVAGILRDFGVSEYLIQEKELDRSKLRAAFGVAILIGWGIGASVFLSRGFVADYFKEPGVGQVLAVLSLNFLILPFASPAFALLSREMAFRKIFVVQTVSNTVQSAAAVGLAYAGHGYMSLAWAPVISILVQTLMLSYMRPRDSLMLPSLRGTRQVLSYGSMFVSSRVIETLTRNAHEFIIGKQFGFTAVGLFSRASGLIDLFYSNFTAAVLRVTTPAFANDHRGGNDLPARYAIGTSMLTVIAWPFFGYVALMSGEIILVLFGSQWLAAAPIASALALSVMPNYLTAMGPSLLAATGHVKRRLLITMAYAPIHLLAILSASQWGLNAMAAAFGISSLVALAIYAHQLPRVLGCRVGQLFGASSKSALVALPCIGAQALVRELCQAYRLNGFISLVLVGVAAVLVWFVVARLAGHPAYREIARFAQTRWQRKPA